MSVMDKFLNFMGFVEDVEEDLPLRERESKSEANEYPEPISFRKKKPNIVPFQSMQTKDSQVKVVLMEPDEFDDAQYICDNLKQQRPVVINLEKADKELARRIVDFVGGTTYALGGSMQKIGNGIILVLPNNMDISGELKDYPRDNEVISWVAKIAKREG